MIILAVDPGKKTGWASYDTTAQALLGATEASGDEFLDRIIPWVDACKGRDVVVVCERFVISGGTAEVGRTDENWSIEQIGLLRHHCRWAGLVFRLQGAGDAKAFAKNPRLRCIGWYRPGKGHANDALRHLLLYIGGQHVDILDRLLGESC